MDFNDIYDEFGNYIHKEDDSEDNSEDTSIEVESNASSNLNKDEYSEFKALDEDNNDLYNESDTNIHHNGSEYSRIGFEQDDYKIKHDDKNSIVLHENKEYYLDPSEVYGDDVEILVEEEDSQHIDVPLIAPIKVNKFDLTEKNFDNMKTKFSFEYLKDMMFNTELIRNLCIVGDLHSGKTTFVDMLIKSTHSYTDKREFEFQERYTDCRKDEQDRGISLKCSPISLVIPNTTGKSYLLNIMDTPGHVNFIDEVCASVRISDGVLLLIDCIIGVTKYVERIIFYCLSEKKKMLLIINQIDRFVLESRLPPYDCYFKLKSIITTINNTIKEYAKIHGIVEEDLQDLLFFPEKSNMGFSSGKYGFCFTLNSFARLYLKRNGITNNCILREEAEQFSARLWGNIYFNKEKNTFENDKSVNENRSFVQFILEPIYKLIIYSVSEESNTLSNFLKTVGIYLTRKEELLNIKERLEVICRRFFGDIGSFTDLVSQNIPNPRMIAATDLEHNYLGPLNDYYSKFLRKVEIENCPTIVFICKQYHSEDFESFYSFGRVYCGTLRKGDKVRVLGESYLTDDSENYIVRIIDNLWIFQSRYKIEVTKVPAGNWVLISGLNNTMSKSSTIIVNNESNSAQMHILRPIKYINKSVIKLAIEPQNPLELPKMLEGLKSINKSYNISRTKVEENGEHVIFGTGELYLDCIMHDLRCLYGNLDVKVSDPMVEFCETVTETSVVKCYADSNNNLNRLYIIAEPLNKGIVEDIENDLMKINLDSTNNFNNKDPKHYSNVLSDKYGWDKLAIKSLWAFGPDLNCGINALIDDTSSITVDKKLLYDVKQDIIQGFNWSTNEGPLIEERVRNVKFKILDVKLSSNKVNRGTGQIVPATRRACYTAMFLASPKIMEPIYLVEIICPTDMKEYINNVLSKRRGHAGKEIPIPATPLVLLLAFIPAIESFGFETDLRIHTSGQAFCTSCFDHWAIVPGNPLDRNIVLRPLEKSPIPHLAREFLLKTRRRKGIGDDINIQNFINSPEIIKALNYKSL